MLANDIDIEHACEMSNACTTCHIYVREGFDDIEESGQSSSCGNIIICGIFLLLY
jgi:2Fe-2S ferredoxin